MILPWEEFVGRRVEVVVQWTLGPWRVETWEVDLEWVRESFRVLGRMAY